MKPTLARIASAVAFTFVAGYAIVSLAGPRGISAWREKERQIRIQEQRNTELERANEAARARVDRLETDPAEQERIVRDRLKMLRPGERVFVLPEERPNASRK
jgi:cell division protein FtsB